SLQPAADRGFMNTHQPTYLPQREIVKIVVLEQKPHSCLECSERLHHRGLSSELKPLVLEPFKVIGSDLRAQEGSTRLARQPVKLVQIINLFEPARLPLPVDKRLVDDCSQPAAKGAAPRVVRQLTQPAILCNANAVQVTHERECQLLRLHIIARQSS